MQYNRVHIKRKVPDSSSFFFFPQDVLHTLSKFFLFTRNNTMIKFFGIKMVVNMKQSYQQKIILAKCIYLHPQGFMLSNVTSKIYFSH